MLRWFTAFCFAPLLACGHDPGLSTVTVDFGSREILVQAVFAAADLPASSAAARSQLTLRDIELQRERQTLKPLATEVRESAGDFREYTARYSRPVGAITLSSPLLAQMPLGHRQMLTLRGLDGSTIATELLDANRSTFTLPAVAPDPPRSPALLAGLSVAILAGAGVWLLRRRTKEVPCAVPSPQHTGR